MRQTQRYHHFLQLFFNGLQVIDDALSCCNRDAREWWMLGHLDSGDRVVESTKILCRSADDEQQRVNCGVDNFGIRRLGGHRVNLNAERCAWLIVSRERACFMTRDQLFE